MGETINLSDVTSIEALNALIVAAQARREQLERGNLNQLRQNLKAVARDMGLSFKALVSKLLDDADNDMGAPRLRRPSDEVRSEKAAAAKRMKYYDPVSGTGWNGMGRTPRAFRDKDSGLADRKFLEACKNPHYEEWASDAAAE